ncbi:MAG: SsrA-binding protein SmpB [Elusimicrobia bacterium]|jgi:SsrA-binding protein|nr:SsrA-binding protein SmpB [Elusimicrobiota bacterium]
MGDGFVKVVARNRRAFHKYHILESFDGGLTLTGPEVKSLRAGDASLDDGFGRLDRGEVFLWNVHIAPYKQGSLHVEQLPTRRRKILLHKAEIKRLIGKMTIKGLTLIPLEIYFGDSGYAKVKLGLAKGKNAPDQREDMKRKDLDRELRRDFSGRRKI